MKRSEANWFERIWNESPLKIVSAIVLGATFLRLFQLSGHPLGLDGTFTIKFTDYSWSDFFPAVSETDVHPPLYYAIVKVFRGLGFADTVFAARLPSVLFNLLTIPLLIGIVRNLFEPKEAKWVGIFSCLLFTIAASQIYISQTARPYALMVFAMSLTLFGGSCFLKQHAHFDAPVREWLQDKSLISALFSTTFGLVLLMWSHNIGLIYAATTGLIVFALLALISEFNFRALTALSVCGALAILLWLPNLPSLIGQASNVSEQYWIPELTVLELTQILFEAFGVLVFSPLSRIPAALISIPIGVLGLLGMWTFWREKSWQGAFLVAVLAAPLLIFIALSILVQPILITRILHPLFPIWIIIVSYGAYRTRDIVIPFGGAAIAFILYGLTGLHYVSGAEKTERWDKFVQIIEDNSPEGAIVFTVPNSSALPLGYYVDQANANIIVHPIPSEFPAREDHYDYPTGVPGVPGMDAKMVEKALTRIDQTATLDKWIILRGYQIYDQGGHVKPLLDQRFCYQRFDTDVWYLFILKLIPLESDQAADCNFDQDGIRFEVTQ